MNCSIHLLMTLPTQTKKHRTKTQEAVQAIQWYSPHTGEEVLTSSVAQSSTL